MTIKQEIQGVGYEKLPTVALLAPKMQDFILSMNSMGFSEKAIRIVLILSANLKEKQMQLRKADKLKQLELFDNEWIDVDNDKTYSVQFKFKFSDFLPKGSKNYYLVRKGLDELQEKNYLIEFQKEAPNGKIKKYQLKSAFISSYLMEEGNGFKMIINNFWYRTLIDVTYSFNSYIKPIIFNLGSGSTIFYMYLKKLNFIKPHDIQFYESLITEHNLSGQTKGTRMKKETFKETFNLTWEYDSDLKRKVLDAWRSELNKFADLSFAYRMDDKYIYLITYEPTKNLIENNLIDIEEAKIRSAINYKMKNKNLGFGEITYLLEIYLKYTYSVVFKATERKTVLKDIQGQNYIDMLLVLVESHVKANKIDISKIAYSNTKEMRTVIR
ncbi:MAG: hypothetical protein EOP43_04910, partial [Sphingobacteriaceae bacterium]